MNHQSPRVLTWLFSILLLGSFASLQIPQPNLDGFPRNFCPADLRIFGEDCGGFGILNFQTQNLNDTVFYLNVCHGHPPLAGYGKTMSTRETSIVYLSGSIEKHFRRMLKKAVQQGRSERRGEAYASVR